MVDKKSLDNLTGQEIKEMINENSITLEELDYSSLMKVFNYEIDMLVFGTGDMEIIDKCSYLLDEMRDEPFISDERFKEIVDKAFAEHVIIIDDDKKTKCDKKRNRPIKHIVLRRIAIVAAIVAIMFVGTTLVAAAFGFNIFEYLGKVVRQPEGTENNVDEFTFYHDGKSKKYNAIQDMVENEKLEIMFPTKLPEGISLTKVNMAVNESGNMLITFATNSDNVSITVELSTVVYDTKNPNIYEYNGITYYIEQAEQFVAYCYYNNNSYYITANTKDDLITIINNLKE